MTAEATLLRGRHWARKTLAAAAAGGDIHQLPDGRAAVRQGLGVAAVGDQVNFVTTGQFRVPKATNLVILDGGRVYWDKSASLATPLEAYGTNDFYLGVAVGDAADTEVLVNLNVAPHYVIELHRGEWENITILTAGAPSLSMVGGTAKLAFSATAEAQKVDLLSKQSVLAAAGFIFEAKFANYDKGDAAALDFNIGMANATHATDADAITESAFFHMDGNSLDLLAESDDGTTEVAATDTTIDLVDDTFVEVWIDGRDLANLKYYVNGVRVLPNTTFKLNAAAGPLKALVHLEKTSDDTPGDFRVGRLAVRTLDL